VIGLYRGESIHQRTDDYREVTRKGILTLTALAFVLLIPFVGFGELRGVLGKEKLRQIFFQAQHLESQSVIETAGPASQSEGDR